MTYPPLPVFKPQTQDEPLAVYGQRALQFVLEHRFASIDITDAGLEQALKCSAEVIAGELADVTRERLHETRLIIMAALDRRRKAAAEKDKLAAAALAQVTGGEPDGEPQLTDEQLIAAMFKEMMRLARNLGKDKDNPDGGKKARLQKPQPKLPSGGAEAALPRLRQHPDWAQ